MKVLVTGHRGFIGQHVFADWRRELGYANFMALINQIVYQVLRVVIMI